MNAESEKSLILEIMFLIFLVVWLFSSIACLHIGKYNGELKIKKQAIQNNAAEYIVDRDGNVTFQWKDQKHE
jgi:hypothetical protein